MHIKVIVTPSCYNSLYRPQTYVTIGFGRHFEVYFTPAEFDTYLKKHQDNFDMHFGCADETLAQIVPVCSVKTIEIFATILNKKQVELHYDIDMHLDAILKRKDYKEILRILIVNDCFSNTKNDIIESFAENSESDNLYDIFVETITNFSANNIELYKNDPYSLYRTMINCITSGNVRMVMYCLDKFEDIGVSPHYYLYESILDNSLELADKILEKYGRPETSIRKEFDDESFIVTDLKSIQYLHELYSLDQFPMEDVTIDNLFLRLLTEQIVGPNPAMIYLITVFPVHASGLEEMNESIYREYVEEIESENAELMKN